MKTTTVLSLMIAFLAISLASTLQAQVIWLENFDGQLGKGVTGGTPPVTNMTGITKWSVETTSALAGNQNFVVISNRTAGLVFEANNVKDETTWQSETIHISSNDFVELTVDLSEVGGMDPTDYIRTYFSVDGQAETLFYENGDLSDDFVSAVAKQEAVAGSNLVITIKTINSSADEKHRFDNIAVTVATPASNQPPALAVNPAGTKAVVADNPISFDLIATEEYLDRNDIITLKMTSGPAGSLFSETNGTTILTNTFSWTPDTEGTYTADFEASDKDGTNALQVTIKVYPGKKVVWIEDFNDPAIDGKGAYGPSNTVDLIGVANWTVDITNTELTASSDYFKVRNSRFEAQDLDGEAVWISTNIDISASGTVSAEVDIDYAGGAEAADYIRTYYSVNGAAETLFEENGDLSGIFTNPIVAKQSGLSGSTLTITIRCDNNASNEGYYFDNVKVLTPILSGIYLILR